MPGLDLTCSLQPGNCFTHYCAAHTMGLHDRGFGGQLVASFEQAVTNLLGQHRHQLLREAAAFSRKAGDVVWVFHGENLSRIQGHRGKTSTHHSSSGLYDHTLTVPMPWQPRFRTFYWRWPAGLRRTHRHNAPANRTLRAARCGWAVRQTNCDRTGRNPGKRWA